MDIKNVNVRALIGKDMEVAEIMDEFSGNNLSQWLEDLEEDETSDYAFGIFDGDVLIGYCSIGYADDCAEMIENHKDHTSDSLLLSDVYIRKEYRGREYGLKLINEAMQIKADMEPGSKNVYLTLLYDDLSKFYQRSGFRWIDDTQEYAMVKDLKCA